MRLTVRIDIRLRPEVLDPEGEAVLAGLTNLDLAAGVTDLRVGRLITMVLEAPSHGEARARVDDMCRRLLANPLIEDWSIDVSGPAREPVSAAGRHSLSDSPSAGPASPDRG